MAVDISESIIIVDCLQGMCLVEQNGEEATSLQAGQRVSLINGDLGVLEQLDGQAVSSWNDLCGDCLSIP